MEWPLSSEGLGSRPRRRLRSGGKPQICGGGQPRRRTSGRGTRGT
uniref:Uncharacterized protein n=1 Tax=Arundo donax TaxID=35708 RepID=A0A0A8YS56_ARUDO